MAKKAKNGGKTGGLNRFWSKHWQKILLVVVIIGIAGFIGVNRLIIYNQQKQFNAAEVSLDKLYGDIVAQVGQPTSVKKDKSCSYASTEGGHGSRGCGISYSSVYEVDNAEQANSISQKLIKYVHNSTLLKVKFEQKGTFKDGYSSTSGDSPAYDIALNGVALKNCTLDTKYTDINYKNYPLVNHSNITLSFGCGGPAKAEFYPVKN